MLLNKIKSLTVFTLLITLFFGCGTETKTEIKVDYQLNRASVDISKAFRQFQMADNAYYEENVDATVNHLSRGLDLFQTALDHLAKAEAETYEGASKEIDNGNDELQKSVDEYQAGNNESAQNHYNKALGYYDKALDMLDMD